MLENCLKSKQTQNKGHIMIISGLKAFRSKLLRKIPNGKKVVLIGKVKSWDWSSGRKTAGIKGDTQHKQNNNIDVHGGP